jgi:hypothetical protein
MPPYRRALIAAAAYAVKTGDKVAGLYDHAAGQHLRIAAECRGHRLQAYDGERAAPFGGTLPDLYDEGDGTFVSLESDGETIRGYDRGSAGFYDARVGDRLVQLYDHQANLWFAFTLQIADEPDSAS